MGGFFNFFKNNHQKPENIPFRGAISDIPIFSNLKPEELHLVEERIRHVEFKKGDIIYRTGEEADTFYIIISGRFSVINEKGITLAVLSRGDYFGESSLLLERSHSATVEAKNDGVVLKIGKQDFLNLLDTIPALYIHLSRTLGLRLRRGANESEISGATILSVMSENAEEEKRFFAINLNGMLAQSLKKKSIVVGMENGAHSRFSEQFGPFFSISDAHSADFTFSHLQKYIRQRSGGGATLRIGKSEGDTVSGKNIPTILSHLIEHYDFVILDLPERLDDCCVRAIHQSDLIYYLIREENRKVFKAASIPAAGYNMPKVRIVLCEKPDMNPAEIVPFSPLGKSSSDVFCILPNEKEAAREEEADDKPWCLEVPDTRYAKTIRFVARELTGNLIGLALGSGAAFGYAHIGVLKVIEEEKIPIDIIAGSSMGALIAALWAAGLNSKELTDMGRDFSPQNLFFKWVGFSDLSAPHFGFFKGNQISNYLRGIIDHKTFRSLNIPLKIVGANLFTGEEVVFDDGDVVNAIRASISIPGIFRPVKYHDQYILDGGVIDPLPVKVLNHFGAKKIIAVNVLSAPEDHIRRKELNDSLQIKMEESIEEKKLLSRLLAKVKKDASEHYRVNVMNVLMNTIQFLEYEIAKSSESSADIVIHPDLHDSHWAEFHSIKKFVQKGEEKTKERLTDIKRLVEETS